ncbi:uncharacterized protein LOC118008124 isoform X2 [Mirounga leonina]|uniref:uncharacterized protein LOC118008124 isoform X2 n=1 Tax=Mirounga leonina TaxID=9715 RepID=UPI00156C10F2|nr:uncharacterized protein LOC118008124 isoform X2 [Mirounga leonina]
MPLGLAGQSIEANGMLILLPGACPTKFLHHLHFFFNNEILFWVCSLSLLPVLSSMTEQWPIKISICLWLYCFKTEDERGKRKKPAWWQIQRIEPADDLSTVSVLSSNETYQPMGGLQNHL